MSILSIISSLSKPFSKSSKTNTSSIKTPLLVMSNNSVQCGECDYNGYAYLYEYETSYEYGTSYENTPLNSCGCN